MYKIDLHTHSIASPDGALNLEDYRQALGQGRLDYIAVTDHDTIDGALRFHEELGEQIIVGEEITTTDGEVVGLYLRKAVPAGLSALETAEAIHAQGGLVYIPHPFETVRKGLSVTALDAMASSIDIVEVHNGRAIFQNRGAEAQAWVRKNRVAAAASSDAHGKIGWGKTYSLVPEKPASDTLTHLLGDASYEKGLVGLRGIVYPKLNRLRKKLGHA